MAWWNPTRLVVIAFVLAGCVGTAVMLHQPSGQAAAEPEAPPKRPQESRGLPEPDHPERPRGRASPPPEDKPPVGNATEGPGAPAGGRVVRFLAWGDTGHGSPSQYRTAEAARQVCARKGCDFVLQLGDNIYNVGVDSVRDPQWQSKFERPYANLSVPFQAVLGNHDVAKPLENSTRDNGDAQVAYDDVNGGPSTKWNMPARNYSFEHGPAAFWAFDLTPLADRSGLDAREKASAHAVGAEVNASNATWRIAYSHFPYVSNGAHGDAGRYDGIAGSGGAIKQFVETALCGRADLYLAAHDHDLEWLAAVPSCGATTEFIVSGAASEPNPVKVPPRVPAHFSLGGQLGFFWFELTDDTLRGRAYDDAGRVIFERVLRK